MITILKRSTALAACAALSLGVAQAVAQSDMASPEGDVSEPPAASGEAVPGDQLGEAPAGEMAGD
ncbi:MAG TPA: hypothetical protein VK090_01300, partial [Paracoccaceae bacterium]|nr:hypothetical protein [Paracoccaceae bacterium]